MSNPAKPAWPDPGALPFASPGHAAFGQPPSPDLAGGIDFIKKLWGQVPGNAAVPGFLLPTLDLDELDKRVSDLKAAESWLEVNLNLLRATIQGLEVQRHTIAAIRSFGAGAETPQSPHPGTGEPLTPSGLPAGWPVAQARAHEPGAPAPTTRQAQASIDPAPAGDAIGSSPGAKKKATRRPRGSAVAPQSETPAAAPASSFAGLAANNWLGYMQEQFAKVAQAALANPEVERRPRHEDQSPHTAKAKAASKAASRRRPATGSKGSAR